MKINLIQYNSPAYEKMIQLRMEVLRKPLGLSFTQEDLEKETNDTLIGAFEEDNIIGCCVLTKINDQTIKLRQMAVEPARQGSGIGAAIISFAEQWAKNNGFSLMVMHARDVASGFYKKLGYTIEGAPFSEVTIPHYKMVKELK